MRSWLTAAVVAGCCSTSAWAQDTDCGAAGPKPQSGEIKLVSWNIQELANAVKVYDRLIRSGDDFKDLRMYRRCHDGDVYALQEMATPICWTSSVVPRPPRRPMT